MENLLYTIALIFITLWAVGYLMYNADGIIHVLLIIAIMAIIVRVIKRK